LHITKVRRVFETHLTKRFLPLSTPRTTHCFIYAMNGQCLFTLENGKTIFVKAGEIIFLSSCVDYSMDIRTDRFDYFVCNFDADFQGVCRCFSLNLKTTQEVEKVFRRLNRSFRITDAARELSCLADLNQLYALIVQNASATYVPGSVKAKVEEARVHLQTYSTDPNLRLTELAEWAGVSDAYFRKLFREVYGQSPLDFLICERIACAKKLLELEKLPLEDVAVQSGFSSLPYFCKMFKTRTGTTPARYRKQYGG